MSSDANTSVVAAIINGAPANSSGGAPVIFPTIVKDTNGAYNASTGRYTVQTAGFYSVSAAMNTTVTDGANLSIYKNAAADNVIGYFRGGNVSGSATIQCNAGDIIDVRASSATTTSTGTLNNNLNIQKLSGPSQIAASEEINAIYTNASGQSISTSSVATVTGWTKVKDSHNAFSTSGVFTAPVSGAYLVSLQLAYNSAGTVAGNQYNALVNQAGSATRTISISTVFSQATATVFIAIPSGSTIVNMLAGDTLTLNTFQSSGGSRNLASDATYNVFSISKVGNY